MSWSSSEESSEEKRSVCIYALPVSLPHRCLIAVSLHLRIRHDPDDVTASTQIDLRETMPVQTRSQTHSRDAATAPALAPAHPEVARRQRSGQRAPPPLRRLSPYGETLARYLPRLGKSVGDGVLGNPRVGKSRLSRKGRQPFQTEDDSPQLDTPTVARFDSNARHPKGGIGTLRSVEEEEGATEQSNSAAAAATASEAGRAPGSKPWVPSLVVGAPFGDDLSALETADRKVEQWRAILRYHEENLPRAVSPVRRMLNAAVEERSKLDDDSESNTVPK
ncbi:hypothetical protein VTK73DRAFT_2808 [Phialemonium thermophilum]|uniref:Uncharacterized protein n=1 Tax=Phialemonium thermophilum TaxID=223376 RepID=A0ABR3VQ59_9PEZI